MHIRASGTSTNGGFAELAQQQAEEEKKKYEAIQAKPTEIKSRLDRLRQERPELQVALEAKEQEIALEEANLAPVPEELESQRLVLSVAIDQAIQQWGTVKEVPGTDEEDTYLLAQIDQLRLNAIEAIQRYL